MLKKNRCKCEKRKKIRLVTCMSMKRTTGSRTATTIIIRRRRRRRWRVNVKWASVKHLHNLCVCVGSFDASSPRWVEGRSEGAKPGSRFRRRHRLRHRRGWPGERLCGEEGPGRTWRAGGVVVGEGKRRKGRWVAADGWEAAGASLLHAFLLSLLLLFFYTCISIYAILFIFYSRNFYRRQTTGFGIPSKRLARRFIDVDQSRARTHIVSLMYYYIVGLCTHTIRTYLHMRIL